MRTRAHSRKCGGAGAKDEEPDLNALFIVILPGQRKRWVQMKCTSASQHAWPENGFVDLPPASNVLTAQGEYEPHGIARVLPFVLWYRRESAGAGHTGRESLETGESR